MTEQPSTDDANAGTSAPLAIAAGTASLDDKISSVLGGRTASALQKSFGMQTLGELFAHYPRRYAKRGELTALSDLPLGENVTIVGQVIEARERTMKTRRGSIVEIKISDGKGIVGLTFFNQRWRLETLRPGVRGIFAGKITDYRGTLQLAHPHFAPFEEHDDDGASGDEEEEARARRWAEAPIPIYPATNQVPSTEQATPEFAQRLMELLGKDQKDRK